MMASSILLQSTPLVHPTGYPNSEPTSDEEAYSDIKEVDVTALETTEIIDVDTED